MVIEPNSLNATQLDFIRRKQMAENDCRYLEGWVSIGYGDSYDSIRCKYDYNERECGGRCSQYQPNPTKEERKREILDLIIGILGIIAIISAPFIIIMIIKYIF